MPAAVPGELCLVCMCVPVVSLEKHTAGIPLGMQEGEGIKTALVSCLNQRGMGLPLKA